MVPGISSTVLLACGGDVKLDTASVYQFERWRFVGDVPNASVNEMHRGVNNKTPLLRFRIRGVFNVKLRTQIDKSTAFLKVGSPLFLGVKNFSVISVYQLMQGS